MSHYSLPVTISSLPETLPDLYLSVETGTSDKERRAVDVERKESLYGVNGHQVKPIRVVSKCPYPGFGLKVPPS